MGKSWNVLQMSSHVPRDGGRMPGINAIVALLFAE